MPDCIFGDRETMFIGAIDPSLIRDARMHNMTPEKLLDLVLRHLDGQLAAHLERHPCVCKERMEKLLSTRMETIIAGKVRGSNCPSWAKLVEIAVRGDYTKETHERNCKYCERDIRQIRARLPVYDEFHI